MTHIYDWGLRGPEQLAIKCTRCSDEARFIASTGLDERDRQVRDQHGRCTCSSCGYAKAHRLNWPADAYYCIEVVGVELWAWSRVHALAIRNFVDSKSRDASAYPGFKLSLLQLPSEVLENSARDTVVSRLDRLLEDGG